MVKRKSGRWSRDILPLAFIVVFSLSFLVGRFPVNPFTALKILLSKVIEAITFGRFSLSGWSGAEEAVVVSIRFPRIALASLVGAALSVSGASYQGMFRNPMVSPDLLGASTGAGFGAAIAILLGGSYFAITLSSFFFGLLASGVGSMSFLPQEFRCAQEWTRAHLPSHHVTPLVAHQW